MTSNRANSPVVPEVCCRRLSITPIRYLGGRVNRHWLVGAGDSLRVLRKYAADQSSNYGYELQVLSRLRRMGWPVPEPVDVPIDEDGHAWCLFTLLPGAANPDNSPAEQRARGRLLAELHQSTALLRDLGQREGFCRSEKVVRSPSLHAAVRRFEGIDPTVGHLLRWHLEKTCELFDRVRVDEMESIVLHSDFTPWNLLYENGRLSGIIDFESTHLNYRVSDFAMSWRGYQRDVIDGYTEVHKLSDADFQLLVPAYWSWLFLGVEESINDLLSGRASSCDFEWQTKKLLLRSELHEVEPYPGRD